MAQFTNQAQLTYKNTTTNSNVAVGEILEVISVTKTAVTATYGQNDTITYIISIINSGVSALNNLTLTDNLGAYNFGQGTLTPLEYTENSIQYYVNGVLQSAPSVNSEDSLIITGINVPAGGNAIIVYEASVNSFAPIGQGGQITNTATVSCANISPVSAQETVTAENAPNLTITKSISPVPVAENGTVTYTFLIQNTGNTPVVATDNAFITDLFNPILSSITATFNGQVWTEGVEYNYNQATGLFESVQSEITVPAATFTRDPASGAWSITPGTSTLVVTGTI